MLARKRERNFELDVEGHGCVNALVISLELVHDSSTIPQLEYPMCERWRQLAPEAAVIGREEESQEYIDGVPVPPLDPSGGKQPKKEIRYQMNVPDVGPTGAPNEGVDPTGG